jgi:16S rRNA (guanine527-N7)-methyltransferase
VSIPIPSEVREQAAAYGVQTDGEIGQKLAAYLEQLLETNRSFNLTSVTEPEQAWPRHIVDSLSLLPSLLDRPDLKTVVDVGSGGGLPALPLAIALPHHSFTLLESIGKKARFLADVSAALGLTNVQVLEERAETFGQAEGREEFDVCTSRAVSRLPVLLELTLPLVRVGGLKLALKGEQAEQEVAEAKRALQLLGGTMQALRRTPTGTIVSIAKTQSTPAKYPRRAGEPKRAPLL